MRATIHVTGAAVARERKWVFRSIVTTRSGLS